MNLNLDAILDVPPWLVAVLFFTPMVVGISFYLYKTRHARLWRKGLFPQNITFNQDHLLEAYLALGAKLMLYDRQNQKGKTLFINEYFNRYFRSANYPFGDSLLFSLRHPIKIESVCAWLKKHLISEAERAQVLYFLIGLILISGKITERELQLLKLISKELNLSDDILKRILALYLSYQQDTNENAKTKTYSAKSLIETYSTILDVKGDINLQNVKKAYRKMAKIYHPDVFSDASEAQQKIAEEKFILIRNAYDNLVKLL